MTPDEVRDAALRFQTLIEIAAHDETDAALAALRDAVQQRSPDLSPIECARLTRHLIREQQDKWNEGKR